MHPNKLLCSKPNKQIKNIVAYSLQILSFIFKTWELIRRGTERLKTMLASPVAALRTCATLLNMTLAVMLRHECKCKREKHSCVPACFQRVINIICNYFIKRYLSVTALTAAFPLLVSRVI
jgi:hypothetical protein